MEQVSFKQRNRNRYKKIKLHYGDTGFINFRNCRFEYAYFYIIKRYLKNFFKFKYALGNYFKLWVFLKVNFPISKKSKNSRMGKGKGAFVGWVIKLDHGHTIFEFKNINLIRLIKLKNYWNKMLKSKLILHRKN